MSSVSDVNGEKPICLKNNDGHGQVPLQSEIPNFPDISAGNNGITCSITSSTRFSPGRLSSSTKHTISSLSPDIRLLGSGRLVRTASSSGNLSEIPLNETATDVTERCGETRYSIPSLSPYLNDCSTESPVSVTASLGDSPHATTISEENFAFNSSRSHALHSDDRHTPNMPNVEDGLSSGSDSDFPSGQTKLRTDQSVKDTANSMPSYGTPERAPSARFMQSEGPESLVNPPLVHDIWGIMNELKQTLADEKKMLNRSDNVDHTTLNVLEPPRGNHSVTPRDSSSCSKLVVRASVNQTDDPTLSDPSLTRVVQPTSSSAQAAGLSDDADLSGVKTLQSPETINNRNAKVTTRKHQSSDSSRLPSRMQSSEKSASCTVASSNHSFGTNTQHNQSNFLRHQLPIDDQTDHSESSESDEDTRHLLETSGQPVKPIYIPELKEESQLQLRQRSRVRNVSIRHPDFPDSLIDGVLFHARYLGSTQLTSERQSSRHSRMVQAQEAVNRVKAPDDENQPSVPVEFFVSTNRLVILSGNLQEILIDHELRLVSYIADIGELFVLMARRPLPSPMSSGHASDQILASESTSSALGTPPDEDSLAVSSTGTYSHPSQSVSQSHPSPSKLLCHVLESSEARIISQTVGHAFQLAYFDFLRENGIDYLSSLKPASYEDVLDQQEIFCDELAVFSDKKRHKQITVPKLRGEPLGVVIVPSGWGSLLPSVLLANMNPTGPAARCGQLNIGNHIISVNGQSLISLPLDSCRQIIKSCRSQASVQLTVVDCPPVVEVLIRRPSIHCQLGFSVQDGVVCSLLRGGIAERGGIRVDHRIIEINGQSVVAVPHEKIVQLLSTSVGEIHIRTMPTSVFRLLTGQETPHYI